MRNFLKSIIVFVCLLFCFLFLPLRTIVFATAPDNYQWVYHETGLYGARSISTVVVDPTNVSIVYALAVSGGVFKSTDGGTNWAASNTGLPTSKIVGASNLTGRSMVIDPNDHLTIYAQINGRVYKSVDGAATWTEKMNGVTFSCGTFGLVGIVIDPTNSNHLYTSSIESGCSGGIWESTDAGNNWTQIAGALAAGGSIGGEGYNDAWPLALDPSDVSKMYFVTVHAERFRSTDGGQNWTTMTFPGAYAPESHDGDAIAIHPTSHKVLIGTRGGMLFSTDYGATLTEVPTLSGVSIIDVRFAPSNPSIVYALNPGGKIYKSVDAGTTWTLMSTNALTWNSVDISPTDPTVLFLATNGNGMYTSVNSGTTVSAINTGLPTPIQTQFLGFVQAPSNPDIIYLGVASDGFYKSTDGGYTWTLVQSGTIPTSLTIDPTDPNILLGTSASNVVRSADGGASWSNVYALNAMEIVIAPSNHNIMWAEENAGGTVIKSIDNGLT